MSEIGLRRSVGVTRCGILSQFLAESTMMAVTVGTIGILLGAVLSGLIARYAGWATHVSFNAIELACIVSLAVGVFSGTYPAIRIASLGPVEAVRYE